jgi:hypothetical protein
MAKAGKASNLGMLEGLLEGVAPATLQPTTPAPAREPEETPADRPERFQVDLPHELVERVRNAAVATGATLVEIAQAALEHELRILEDQNGGPFPERPRRRLRPGRRLD